MATYWADILKPEISKVLDKINASGDFKKVIFKLERSVDAVRNKMALKEDYQEIVCSIPFQRIGEQLTLLNDFGVEPYDAKHFEEWQRYCEEVDYCKFSNIGDLLK